MEIILGLIMWVTVAMGIPADKLPKTQLLPLATAEFEKLKDGKNFVCYQNTCWGSDVIVINTDVEWDQAKNAIEIIFTTSCYLQYKTKYKSNLKAFLKDQNKVIENSENLVKRWLEEQSYIRTKIISYEQVYRKISFVEKSI